MAEAPARAGLAAILLAAACARPGVESAEPVPGVGPELRVAVVPEAASVRLGGGAALMIRSADGAGLVALPAGFEATVTSDRGGLRIRFSTEDVTLPAPLTAAPADSGRPTRLEGRDYRGTMLVSPVPAGVMVVNVVPMEQYLAGVVAAELGRRDGGDFEALRAQAVVSRTVALRRLGLWRGRGYDLLATVADQAYVGTGVEYPLATRAVEETHGLVITWQGTPIDAFFHSTCGGRTAEGTEVFAGADRPYLRSVDDRAPGGAAWCAISPRFRWRETWTGETLYRTLRATLPAAGGSVALADGVQDLIILGLTATGRVERMELAGSAGRLVVSGPTARLVLRTADGSALRSARFALQINRSGGRITHLVAEGGGAGHGVGLCQWGAIGRSRAGQRYEEILSAYFPGTRVGRTS